MTREQDGFNQNYQGPWWALLDQRHPWPKGGKIKEKWERTLKNTRSWTMTDQHTTSMPSSFLATIRIKFETIGTKIKISAKTSKTGEIF